MKFLHTSDWHLGRRAPTYAATDESTPERLAAARRDTVARIGRMAADEGCAFIVVAGDVFDSNNPDDRNLARSIDVLRKLPVPTYLLPGNHDSYDQGSVYRRREFTDLGNVHVITDAEPIEVTTGVELVGAPMTQKFMHTDPVKEALVALEPAPGGVTRVFCGHGQFVGYGEDDGDDSGRVTTERPDLGEVRVALAEGRIHYAAFGDRHLTTEVDERVWYSGSPEPTEFRGDDEAVGNVLIVDVPDDDPAGDITVETVATATWSFRTLEAAINSDESLRAWFDEVEEIPDKDRTLMRYALTGMVNFSQLQELNRHLSDYRSRFAYVRERGSHNLTVLLDDINDIDWGAVGPVPKAAGILAALVEDQGDRAEAAQRALAHLYDLTRRDA